MRAARRKSFPLLAALLLQQILWVGPSFLASGSVSTHRQPNHSRIKLAPERAWTGLAQSRLHGRQSFDAGAETGKTLHVAAACCLVGTLAKLGISYRAVQTLNRVLSLERSPAVQVSMYSQSSCGVTFYGAGGDILDKC